MPTAAQRLTARIDQFKARFTGEMRDFASEVVSSEPYIPRIDDGAYGDPFRDDRPDFVKEANDGWVSIVQLKK